MPTLKCLNLDSKTPAIPLDYVNLTHKLCQDVQLVFLQPHIKFHTDQLNQSVHVQYQNVDFRSIYNIKLEANGFINIKVHVNVKGVFCCCCCCCFWLLFFFFFGGGGVWFFVLFFCWFFFFYAASKTALISCESLNLTLKQNCARMFDLCCFITSSIFILIS